MRRTSLCFFATFAALLLILPTAPAEAQNVTVPPPGANQKASVSQWIGLVEVNVTYNSPDVTAPNGDDRTGKIWGQLVPYGMANLGFGTCGDQCPWRAGANENTVFTVSHDVEIEGQPLAAGSYGLHMIPGEEEWTLVFSNNSTSWGSFFYDEAEDALRVTVKPKPGNYQHWLTYEFTDRQPQQATVALRWENLEVPWTVSVPNLNELYFATLQQELRNSPGFTHLSWAAASTFLVQNNIHPEEALAWAEKAVNDPFAGQEDFNTLVALSRAQLANGQNEQSGETLLRAARHATAPAFGVHGMGRQLIAQGQSELALQIFQANHDRLDGAWPSHVGLARGYSAVGDYPKALEHARKALEQAPDEPNRANLEAQIAMLEKGEDIN